MKQFFRIVLLCFVLLVPAGCNNELKKEIENLNERLDQLTATRIATLDEQVKGIGTTIAALEAQRTEIQAAIDALEAYVNGENAKVKQWAEGLFATIEGLNTLKEYVDAEKTNLEDWVNGSYTTLVMHELLSEVVAGLKSKLDALPDSARLAKRFAVVDSSMRGWVNGQLAGYWTIAQSEAALAAQMKAELTKAYTQAIADAIRDNNGQISASIAGQLAPLNSGIAALQGETARLSGELATMRTEIAKLKARISSMTYIPTHEDGKARVGYLSGPNYEPITPESLRLEFLVRPAEAGEDIFRISAKTGWGRLYFQSAGSASRRHGEKKRLIINED